MATALDDNNQGRTDFLTAAGDDTFAPADSNALVSSIRIFINGASVVDTTQFSIDALGNVTLAVPRLADETVTLIYTLT